MKVLADTNIPLADHFFAPLGHLVMKPGREIGPGDVQDADILLVRSVTRVDENLLSGSQVKFVGSATGGADHLDVDYLNQQGIAWSVAPGCNAPSVADYVLSCVAYLQKQGNLLQKKPRAAVVGVGHIGRLVSTYLKQLNFEVVHCDPLRALNENDFQSVPLSTLKDFDFICLHTPLTLTGEYKTYHLIDEKFLKKQKPGCVILNAGRGAVVDFSALKTVGQDFHWCLDVWENEPNIDLDVLQQAIIATPHVAGYAIESKWRGTYQVYLAACRALGLPKGNVSLPKTKQSVIDFHSDNWRDEVLKVYDPSRDTKIMRETLLAPGVDVGKAFDALRAGYPVRCELKRQKSC